MILKTKFRGLIIVKNKVFFDQRGYFKEILKENEIKSKFPFHVMSFSKKNVIRGLHIQSNKTQGKFVTVLKGKILDVAVDLRKNSKTFGKHYSTIMSEKNSISIYIPPGFAHGICGIEKENYLIYSCSKYRDKQSEIGIQFNDKDLNINWPIKNPILSKKDKNNISFTEYKKKYL